MLAIWVKVRIKPELRQRFLDAIEVDALGSERDEPGCLRFNVLQDETDPNVYYFYEVYTGPEALEAHAALRRVACRRGHLGRSDRGHPVPAGLPGIAGVLGQDPDRESAAPVGQAGVVPRPGYSRSLLAGIGRPHSRFRSSTRRILPLTVLGRALTKSIFRGYL
jgi:quinol monooxygenase YgiN